MFTDYKYQYVIRDDRSETTTVKFAIYQGDYEDVEYEDFDPVKQKFFKVKTKVYRRTTAFNEPLEEYEVTFDGLLDAPSLDKEINKLVKDAVKGKPLSKDMIPEQDSVAKNPRAYKNSKKLK